MPYFIILPLYLAFLGVLVTVGLPPLFFSRYRHLSAYVFAAAFCTIPAFIVANLLNWLVFYLYALLSGWFWNPLIPVLKGQLPEWLYNALGAAIVLPLGGMLFVGPFLASGAGVEIGCLVGILLVQMFKRRRFAACGQPPYEAGNS